MTPLERIVTVFNRDIPDRVPVFNVGGASRQVVGVKLLDMMRNPEVQAKAQLTAQRTIGHDSVSVGIDMALEPEAMGCKVKFNEDEHPMILEPLVKAPEDVDKIKIPDPEKDGRMPINIMAAKKLLDEVGKTVDVSAWFAGPFTLAGLIRGPDFFKDLIKRPDLAHRILRTTTECQKTYGTALLEEGVRTLCIPDPTSSPNVVSPRIYKSFSLPYARELIATLKKKRARILHHICGDTTPILKDIPETGADCVSIDQPPDLAYAKEKIGRRVCLHGNVKTIDVLLKGTPADVERESKNCILKAAAGGGYLLGSSCDFPLNTPIDNIKAMVNAAKKYGSYASDGSLVLANYNT